MVELPGNKSPLVAASQTESSQSPNYVLQSVQQLEYKDGTPGEVALTRILFEPLEWSRGRKSQENTYMQQH